MGKKLNLIRMRFGRLVVKSKAGRNEKLKKVLWLCKCDCGKEIIVATGSLRSGNTESCGCLKNYLTIKRSTTHGMSKTQEDKRWADMLRRCNNPKNISFAYYGGKGIKVCKRWYDFENFYSDMGKRPSNKHAIERKNGNDDYCPENCIWATYTIQSRNHQIRKDNISGYTGVTWAKHERKWVAQIGVNKKCICLGSFHSVEDAIEAREEAELKYW